jgi:hypothetical protein
MLKDDFFKYLVKYYNLVAGEGSLDMQQEGEYTVAYATLAQVRSSPSPTPSHSPVPKPRYCWLHCVETTVDVLHDV